jgi:hypothetical protein
MDGWPGAHLTKQSAALFRLTYSSAADSPPENLTSRGAEDLDARLWLRDIAEPG